MLGAFLWSGAELKSTGAKLKWSHVCTPTIEVGLGLKPLKGWSKAAMLQQLWAVCNKADFVGQMGA